MKSKRWTGGVARMGTRSVETRGKEDHLEYLDVDEMIMLSWIFSKWNGGHILYSSGSG